MPSSAAADTVPADVRTAESVTEGHPDKVADWIADSLLDACLAEDPNAHAAIEVLVKGHRVVVAGERGWRGRSDGGPRPAMFWIARRTFAYEVRPSLDYPRHRFSFLRGSMPVTAKLSRKFYETFGDDVANELVEWFNAVDATYRNDLRELNELNFARFDAKLEQRIAELRAELRGEMKEMRAELIKWMFIFVTGSTFTVLGVMVALLKL